MRGTGSGFTYNVARYLTAAGPFIVGYIAGSAASAGQILDIVSWVAVIPALGALLVLLGVGVETKDQTLLF